MNLTKQEAVARIASLKASNRDDVRLLANMVNEVRTDFHQILAASIIHLGILIPKERSIRAAMWLAEKRRKTKYQLMMGIFQRYPSLATAIIEATADHILLGEDTEDADSVGGLSQREFDAVSGLLLVISGVIDPRTMKLTPEFKESE